MNVWSDTNDWHGTYADVHAEAQRLVGALQAAGLRPGDVVPFQLPNWREAIVSFYALAMGGYVLVPIVHIYGSKEVRFILDQCGARAYISADRFGHVDYLDIVEGAPAGTLPDLALHVVVGDATTSDRVKRIGWDAVDAAEPATFGNPSNPEDVCVLAYTSGTTSAPSVSSVHQPSARYRSRNSAGTVRTGQVTRGPGPACGSRCRAALCSVARR